MSIKHKTTTAMKKNLFALAFLPLFAAAQGLKITSVKPPKICPGDQIAITVVFISGNSTQIKLTAPFGFINWQYDEAYIKNNWHKSFNGSDSTYTLVAVTQNTLGFGTYTVVASALPNDIHTVDASCGTVGLDEPAMEGDTPVYFDMYGGHVSVPRPGEIIVERRGKYASKVLLLE